jgi:hypothetical protein
MAKRRGRRKGLQKAEGRTVTRFEKDLSALKKANKLVAGMSSNARRWLRAQLG